MKKRSMERCKVYQIGKVGYWKKAQDGLGFFLFNQRVNNLHALLIKEFFQDPF
jgi:hypothetical protein